MFFPVHLFCVLSQPFCNVIAFPTFTSIFLAFSSLQEVSRLASHSEKSAGETKSRSCLKDFSFLPFYFLNSKITKELQSRRRGTFWKILEEKTFSGVRRGKLYTFLSGSLEGLKLSKDNFAVSGFGISWVKWQPAFPCHHCMPSSFRNYIQPRLRQEWLRSALSACYLEMLKIVPRPPRLGKLVLERETSFLTDSQECKFLVYIA